MRCHRHAWHTLGARAGVFMGRGGEDTAVLLSRAALAA